MCLKFKKLSMCYITQILKVKQMLHEYDDIMWIDASKFWFPF